MYVYCSWLVLSTCTIQMRNRPPLHVQRRAGRPGPSISLTVAALRPSIRCTPPLPSRQHAETVRVGEVPRSQICARHFHHLIVAPVWHLFLLPTHEAPFLFPQGNTPSGPAGTRPPVTEEDLIVLIKLRESTGRGSDLSDHGAFWQGVEVTDGRVVALTFSDRNLTGET